MELNPGEGSFSAGVGNCVDDAMLISIGDDDSEEVEVDVVRRVDDFLIEGGSIALIGEEVLSFDTTQVLMVASITGSLPMSIPSCHGFAEVLKRRSWYVAGRERINGLNMGSMEERKAIANCHLMLNNICIGGLSRGGKVGDVLRTPSWLVPSSALGLEKVLARPPHFEQRKLPTTTTTTTTEDYSPSKQPCAYITSHQRNKYKLIERHSPQPPSMADPSGATDIVEQYDLLPKMIPYLDKHLLYPLVADRSEGENDKDNMKLRYVLLKDTNMTDYVADLDAQIRGSEKSAEYAKKREDVLKKRDVFEEETATIRGLLEDADVVGNLRSDKVANLEYLKKEHSVTTEMVNQLYEYGQFEYSCGSYQSAGELLYQFRVLVS
jgi:hypothetical protein